MAPKDNQKWPEFLNRFFLLGIFLSVIFWLIESTVHPFFFGEGTFVSEALYPGSHEMWMRFVVVFIILAFSLYAGAVVSRLRRSREVLKHSEEKFRRIVEAADEGIWIVDGDGKTTFVNERMTGMLGYRSDEMDGRCIFDFGFGPQPDEGGVQWALGEKARRDVRLRRKDGLELWATASSAPFSDSGGRASTLFMVSDITQRKRDEAALIEQRNRAQAYLDVVGVMVIGLDERGRVILVNRKGCEILGYSEEEILWTDWFEEFIPERLRVEMREFFKQVVSGDIETSAYYENLVITRAGVEKLVAWNNSVLRDACGCVRSTISSGVDITDRRRAEVVLAEKLDELERFRKATVARELRMKELRDKLNGLINA